MPQTVSIIIPVYNGEAFIEETFRTILEQSYAHWEAIVVDDGSSDNSVQICKKFSAIDDRFQLHLRERLPKSASTCRNIGIEKSKGEFILFLDADDLLAPDCLDRRVKQMKQYPDLDFAVFQMKSFGGKEVLLTREKKNYLAAFLQFDLPWAITCPFWKRAFLVKIGGFNEQFPRLQDPELHVRALADNPKFKVFSSFSPDSFYRLHKKKDRSRNLSYEAKLEGFSLFYNEFSELRKIRRRDRIQLRVSFYKFLRLFILPLDEREWALIEESVRSFQVGQICGKRNHSVVKRLIQYGKKYQEQSLHKRILLLISLCISPKTFAYRHLWAKINRLLASE